MLNSYFSITFLKYYFGATSRYKVHSPFVFDFVENVLEDQRSFYVFSEVNALRKLMVQDQRSAVISCKSAPTKINKVKHIEKQHTPTQQSCRLLFKTVHYYKPKVILELGTGLGITTLHIAGAALDRTIFSIEASINLWELANENFSLLKAPNISSVADEYAKGLGKLDDQTIDCLVVNPLAATHISDIGMIIRLIPESGMIILTDLQNKATQAIWKKLLNTSQINLTVELFHLGIAWKHNNIKEKQNYQLIPSTWRFFI